MNDDRAAPARPPTVMGRPGAVRLSRALERGAPGVLVAAFMLIELAYAWFALAAPDTSRDVLLAQGICSGRAWPLQGPVLGGRFHLSPVWFYLLAPVSCGRHGFLAAALLTGSLSALKYPLAFAVSQRLYGRSFALVFTVGLFALSWPFTLLLFTHTSALLTGLVSALWAFERFWHGGRLAWLWLLALIASVSINLHPSAYAYALLLPLAAWRWRDRRAVRWQSPLVLALFLLPFLPPLLVAGQEAGGVSMAGLLSVLDPGRLGAVGHLGYRLGAGAAEALFFGFVDHPWVGYLQAAATAALALGLVGGAALRLRRTGTAEPQRRAFPRRFVLTALLVVSASVAVMRDFYPYYMLLPMVPFAAALVAWAWSALPGRLRVAGLAGTALALLAGHGLALSAAADKAFGVSVRKLYDLDAYAPHVDFAWANYWFNAQEIARASDALCAPASRAGLHGLYLTRVNDSLSLPLHLACAARLDAAVEPPPDHHVVGLPVGLLRRLGASCPGAAHETAAMAVSHRPANLRPPHIATAYPSQASPEPTVERRYRLRMPGSHALLVGHLDYLNPWRVSVRLADGRSPTVHSLGLFGRVYTCPACGDAESAWRVTVRAPANDPLDIVGFATDRSCSRVGSPPPGGG